MTEDLDLNTGKKEIFDSAQPILYLNTSLYGEPDHEQKANEEQLAQQKFLDSFQYTLNEVLKLEYIYGNDFVTPGGYNKTKEFIDKLLLNKQNNNDKPLKILDFGCGIGGSSFYLASNFNVNVDAYNFSKNMHKIAQSRLNVKKEENNRYSSRINFKLCDPTKLELDFNQYDIIYSRDILLHVFDKKVLFNNFYKWLKPEGTIFITDYCLNGTINDDNMSKSLSSYISTYKYKLHSISTYSLFLENSGFININSIDDTSEFIIMLNNEVNNFKLIKEQFIEIFDKDGYDEFIKSWNDKIQRCSSGDQKWGIFSATKSKLNPNQNKSASKEFLDNHQYTKNGVLRYEKIFGKNFISTGGIKTTKEFITKYMDKYLKKHSHSKQSLNILDVGCGIGGSAFYFAEHYDNINVLGIDLSENMLNIAKERLVSEKQNFTKNSSVSFKLCDATKEEFEPNSFDIIYSRDCILHIYDKLKLFKSFLNILKPEGILFITDYCCGEEPHSAAFNEYLLNRKYHLHTPNEYTKIIKQAGFINVIGKDETKQFVNVLNAELKEFANPKIQNNFINEFSKKDYEYIVDGWKSKVQRCTKEGDQRWGSFIGNKPK